VDRSIRYEFFKPLELADDERPMGYNLDELREDRDRAHPLLTPWASIRYVKVISALFWRELCPGLLGNPISKL